MNASRRYLTIFRRTPMLILPVDAGLIMGPRGSLIDPAQLFKSELINDIDGVLGYAGLFRHQAKDLLGTPQILNLTASTSRSNHSRKHLVSGVEHALRLGVDAVAVHVNITDRYEGKMLQNLSITVELAARYQLPVMGIAYPRRATEAGDCDYLDLRRNNREAYTDLVAHATRVVAELGVDLIKTQYTGSCESFGHVVAAALGVPVVAAGGPPVSEDEAIENARGVILSGGAGVAYGRQVFEAPDPTGFVRRLRSVLESPDDSKVVPDWSAHMPNIMSH